MMSSRHVILLKTGFVSACLAAAFASSGGRVLAAGPLLPERAPITQEQLAPSDYADCERILTSPPVNQLKARTEEGTFGTFQAMALSPALIGVKCRRDQIGAYMEAAGWILDDRTGSYLLKESGFRHDYIMIFYLPDRSFLSFFTRKKASGQANFYFDGNELTKINMGGTK